MRKVPQAIKASECTLARDEQEQQHEDSHTRARVSCSSSEKEGG